MSFLFGAPEATNLECCNVNIEFFIEHGLQYFLLAGLKFNGTKDPVLWLIADSEPGFVAIAHNGEMTTAQEDDMATMDVHAIGRVCDDLWFAAQWPVCQFLNASHQSFLISQ